MNRAAEGLEISSPITRWLVANFGRLTSGGEWIPQIDGLRCVAIMGVVLHHLHTYVTHSGPSHFREDSADNVFLMLASRGAYGVTLFFVISGIVLALPFIKAAEQGGSVALPQYLMRRITRLEPPYLINLALFFALRVLVNGQPAGDLAPHLGASVLYLHNLLYGTASLINGVAWSLEIELQFYLLMPLLGRVFRLRDVPRRMLLVGGVVAGLCARYAFVNNQYIELSFAGQACFFLLGLLIADIHLRTDRSSRAGAWDVAGCAAWVTLAALLLATKAWWTAPAQCALIAIAYLAVLRGRKLQGVFAFAPIAVVGGMCYTIYLYHFLVISAVGRVVAPMTFGADVLISYLATSAACIPIVIAVSALFFRIFERPFMSRRSAGRLSSGVPIGSEFVKAEP